MSSGGARAGAGAKKNQHRIASGELRRALEAALGIPYVQMLAETQVKLFNDFKVDHNVKEYINFTRDMSSRILENQDITVSSSDDLTLEEKRDRINNLLMLRALNTKPVSDASEESTNLSQ